MSLLDRNLSLLNYRRTDSLAPSSNNPRTHSEAQIDQIAESICQFGFTNPILVDGNNRVIAGHGRLAAAQKLRLAEVPVIELTHMTEAQKRAYVIADNKLALNAGWDPEILALELKDLEALGFDLSLTGFSGDELAALFSGGNPGLVDPDEIPPATDITVTNRGFLWHLGNHRLLCGDSTRQSDVEHLLHGIRPNLMVTDPPYGVSYDPAWRERLGIDRATLATGAVMNDDRADWREAWALFPGDVAYVWHAALQSRAVFESLDAEGFDIRAQIIWDKTRLVIGRGDYHWQHEPAWYAVRRHARGNWTGGRNQTTVWQIPHRKSESGHGTEKPVECMKRPIENNSSPGQAVYDPFCGSGTTIIAAEVTGRACYAIELDPVYVDVAVRRWQAFTGGTATLDGSDRSFAEIVADPIPF